MASAAGAEQTAASIVQLAAASLVQSDEAHQSAVELKSRSQKLKDEIDRLKSSIPVRAIVRQQSKTKESTTTTSRKEALRQQRQLRDSSAPLASLDCSITIASCSQAQADENNNNNNNNSSASFDSTTASSGNLSGYFECDELSDMVDDSLFELTNAGCLSRSVFPREDKMSGTSRRGLDAANLLDDGERTPTNQERVISSDGDVAQQRHPGPQVVALNRESSRPTQGHDIRTNTSNSRARETNLASSSSSSSASSLVAQDQKQSDKIASERRKPPEAGAETGRPHNRKTATKDSSSSGSRRAQISSGQPGGARKKIASAAAGGGGNSCCSDQTDDSPSQRGRREEKKVDSKRQQPARRTARSQSNSTLAEGNTTATTTTTARQRAVNSRCPICCEQAESNHNKNRLAKKAADGRKRRFTFGLFNLFTGGSGGGGGGTQDAAENGRDDVDGDDEMSPARSRPAAATCQHHNLAPPASARQDSIRVARTSAAAAAPAPGHSGSRRPGGGRQFADKSVVGVSGATPTLLPLRLRDSIKITNQRKARHQINQSNRLAARGTPARAPGHAPSHGKPSELLLDLSNTADGQPTPAPTTGTTRSKCVKFTTPDRVLILSPTPADDAGGTTTGTSGSRRRTHPAPLRIPASASVTTGLSTSSTGSPASIIKRSSTTTAIARVPKSSSYSQTEPNKGLDELLARYERDTSLVAEINEKLHLTETIASNRVALDSLGSDEAAKINKGNAHMDDVDEQLLEVARQQQQLAAARTSGRGGSSPFDIDGQQARGGNAGEQREDFSQCDCLTGGSGGQAETNANKRRTADRHEIKSDGGGDNDNEPSGGITRADESKRTLAASATSDRFTLISDLTRRAPAAGLAGQKNMIRAPSDPNAENNQIYEPQHRRQPHRQRADTTGGRTQRAHAFVAPDARHSSSLDQAAAAARHQRRASGNSSPPRPPAEDERAGFSREWLGKQTHAFV